MNKLTRNNLQEFCRTCLSSLQKRRRLEREEDIATNVGNNMDIGCDSHSIHSYDLSLLPQLKKIFVLFTSLDVSKENDEDIYPRSLCQLCYDKMIDFQEFRNLAINSAEVLYKFVNNLNDENIKNADEISKQAGRDFDKKYNTKASILESTYQNNDDDDQLLLPELAALMDKSIKTEPLDENNKVEESCSEIILPNDNYSENCFKPFVKNEIDSEYEEEDDSLFYENNALGTSYNSISDDADVEERTLRNGATDITKMPIKNDPENLGDMQRDCGPTRKRDRKKKSLKCPRCDKQVYKQVYLDAHIRAVHEGYEKPFLCVQCQKAFTRYDQLHTHIQSKHFVEQKFICGLNGCDASFKLSKTLETHRQVVHTSSSSYGFKEMVELHQSHLSQEKNMDQWFCQLCFKSYSSKRALHEHHRRHSEVRNHVCNICGVGKVTSRELQTHMRTHIPNPEKFKCSLCPQEFNHKNAISRHIRVVHEGQRRFACNYCPKRFGTRNSQVCHERLHTGERPFSCELCNKSYPQIEGLKSHMKSHDKNLRKHVCSICSQRFITKKNLIDHEKRHQGHKPHICSICSRGFFSVEDLDKHKQSHTLEEIRSEMTRMSYRTYQDADDSYGEPAVGVESMDGQGSEAFLGYSSSMSSNC